jgi:hypothetical protein
MDPLAVAMMESTDFRSGLDLLSTLVIIICGRMDFLAYCVNYGLGCRCSTITRYIFCSVSGKFLVVIIQLLCTRQNFFSSFM